MNNSSVDVVCQFKRRGVNGKPHLFIRCVVVELLKFKGKMSVPKSDADHQLEGGKWTCGGHQQFLINNSSNFIV